MQPVILEYSAGTKGDFLANLLLGKELTLEKFNKSPFVNPALKHFLHQSTEKNNLDKNQLVKILEKYKNEKIVPVHNLSILEKFNVIDLLKEYGYTIKKIHYDKKYYTTVSIESYIKNISAKINGVEYAVDKILIERNLEINEKSQQAVFKNVLNYIKNTQYSNFHHMFNYSFNENKSILQYEDLYINFNLTDSLFNNIDLENYKAAVARTWCPTEIELFGRTWNLRDYGYLQF
jgi:hypothetical protein